MPDFICKDELKRMINTEQPCTYEELEELIDRVPVLDIEKLINENRIVKNIQLKRISPMTELEKLESRRSTLQRELATVRQAQALSYDLKQATIEWYEHEIKCCEQAIKWEENNG